MWQNGRRLNTVNTFQLSENSSSSSIQIVPEQLQSAVLWSYILLQNGTKSMHDILMLLPAVSRQGKIESEPIIL